MEEEEAICSISNAVSIPNLSIRQHTSAYVSLSIRQHTTAYVSTRQPTSAYVSMRQHTSEAVASMLKALKTLTKCNELKAHYARLYEVSIN